jgi:EmrB/QacA subfamily drug resistance transporter
VTTLQRRTVIIVCIATAMLMLDIAVVNTALPHIARDLHSGLTGLQWVVDAYTVVLAAFVLTAGSLADRFGRRLGLRLGLAVFTMSSVVCALATSIGVLDVARALQGLGAAFMFATSLAVLAAAFPSPKDRAGAFAAYGATIGASFAVGPLVGGLLTTELGWRSIFVVNIPLGLAALAGTRYVRESRDPAPRRPDWAGQGMSSAALFLLVLALLRANHDGWSSTRIVIELVVAAALLIAFVLVERARPNAMLPLAMFRNPRFTGAQVAAFAISASFFAVFFYLTLYLQEILHLSPIRAGLALLPGTALLFVVSGASAQLVGRVSHRVMISGGLAIVAVGLATMTLAGVHSSWTALLLGEALTGIGTGLFNPALSHVALSEVSGAENGLAAGVNDAFRQTGIAVGIAVLGVLVPARDALGAGSATHYVQGLHTALIVSAAVAGLGAVVTAALIRRPAEAGVSSSVPVGVLAGEAA